MLLLSPFSEGSSVADPRFTSRGFPTNRQGPVSDSPIIAIALEHQLAYSGYKDNIDMFLAATALNKTFSIAIPGIDIEEKHFTYSYPLDLPRVCISFKPSTPLDFVNKSIEKLKKTCEVNRVDGIKNHTKCFLLENPPMSFLNFVRPYIVDNAPRQAGYCQIHEALQAAKVMAMIDLYLRTNTYPAFKDDNDVMTFTYGTITHPHLTEKRPAYFKQEQFTKKQRYENVSMTHEVKGKKDVKEEGNWFGVQSDKDVEMDLPDSGYVLMAKPSPAKTSNASWSAPKDVPALPGLCFPYFTGMLTNDKSTLRRIPGTFFIRLFGSDPREGYQQYRGKVGGFASTETGIIMTHILAGVEISVETQAKLHLLFDGRSYLGFCILGAKWAIHRGQQWFLPKTSEDLRADLNTIKTHESSLAEVVAKLEEMDIMNSVEDGCDLAEALSKISWKDHGDEEEVRDLQKWFDENVGRLDFGTRPSNFGIDPLLATLKDIIHTTEPLTNHVHFPSAKDYHLFAKREAICLARFGYLVPSFEIDKGVDPIRVSSMHADTSKGEGARKGVAKILVAMKPLNKAVQDFKIFRNLKRIYQASSERAASYRLHQLGGGLKDRFLKEMGEIIQNLEVDESPGAPRAIRDTPKKDDAPADDFVLIDIPDVFA